MHRFRDRIVLITGAASGIGRTMACRFATEGAKVVVSDISEKGAADTVRMIEDDGGEAMAVHIDVTDGASVKSMVAEVTAMCRRIDVLCNNAGLRAVGEDAVVALSEEEWDRTLAVNLKSVFLCSKYVIPVMRDHGGGVIVNTGSRCSVAGFKGCAAYSAAKGGLLMLTKQMAVEHSEDGIRVCCVMPGNVPTEGVRKHAEAQGQGLTAEQIARMQSPDDIAEAALFLASDAAKQMSGVQLPVFGVDDHI